MLGLIRNLLFGFKAGGIVGLTLKEWDKSLNTAVILTTQRTGSTFLSYWLNNHPNADVYNEVFLKNSPAHDAFRYFYISNGGSSAYYSFVLNRAFYRLGINLLGKQNIIDYLNSLAYDPGHSAPFPRLGSGRQYYAKNPKVKLVAFKLMYDQLQFYAPVKQWMMSNRTSIIHLLRRNLLKNFISKERLRQLGISHKFDEIQATPIRFDYSSFLSYAGQIQKKREYYRAMFEKTNPYIELYYEDVCEDLHAVKNQILTFLDLENVEIGVPDLKKIGTSSFAQEVTNHAEAENSIRSGKYAYLLKEFDDRS